MHYYEHTFAMLEPRPTTPRRTAVKYAIVAVPAAARLELRAWVARYVDAAGECAIPGE